MPIKSILVHVDAGPACDYRLKFAVNLAKYFNSYLTGFYIEPPFPPSDSVTPVAIPNGVPPVTPSELEAHNSIIEREQQQVRKKLSRFSNPDGSEVHCHTALGNNPRKALLDTGRCYDLIIIGKLFGHTDLFGMLSEPATEIAVNVACPVLVVPSKTEVFVPAKQPLIAWNDSREATRAVIDALPFLEPAESVTVFSGHHKNSVPLNLETSRKDILDYLNLHDIHADYIDWELDDGNVGELLLTRADEMGHDLIVMGAYGHSQLRDLFFGSVSRDLLEKTTVPVLLSH